MMLYFIETPRGSHPVSPLKGLCGPWIGGRIPPDCVIWPQYAGGVHGGPGRGYVGLPQQMEGRSSRRQGCGPCSQSPWTTSPGARMIASQPLVPTACFGMRIFPPERSTFVRLASIESTRR